MTILCPNEFHDAVQFAVKADNALEMELIRTQSKEARIELEKRRGQAARTLLQCFGYRANSDALDNKSPWFPRGTRIAYSDGRYKIMSGEDGEQTPDRETFVYSDFAPHSFFFREMWIDPMTRQEVSVYDRVWFALMIPNEAGVSTDKFMEMSEEELINATLDGTCKVSHREEDAKELKAGGKTVREIMRKRIGMCGGIIYHADYSDGRMMPYGSWSTHT